MFKELEELGKSDVYPFHMPGHKRQPSKSIFDAAFSFDITEIDGFDNMHHPDGIIKDLQKKMAEFFHAEEAAILVNGSTSGILTAVSASVKRNGKMIIARNSHKSVYNVAYLRNIDLHYVYPEFINEYNMNGAIRPGDIDEAIKANPDADAVMITSPTYEGVVSDVKAIADICHDHGLPLIVDSAHGAHFGLNKSFDEKYNTLTAAKYADITIISLHKTLPVFTQTAAILMSGDRVDKEKIKEFYSIYQTSSPSYLFMAAIDECLKLIENKGQILFDNLISEISSLRKMKLKNINIIGDEIKNNRTISGYDASKLCITAKAMNGKELYDILRDKYHLQGEMATSSYCLLMTSIMDSHDAFVRLKNALREIDDLIDKKNLHESEVKNTNERNYFKKIQSVLSIQEAVERDSCFYDFEKAAGKIAASWVYAYPPDIPMLVPGELISEEIVEEIIKMYDEGINIIGIKREEFKIING